MRSRHGVSRWRPSGIRARVLLGLALLGVRAAASDTVTVAAAANLVHAVEALDAAFRRAEPATQVTVTIGASGSLFAQLKNGAPFDVFLSADTEYPRQIVAAGLGPADSMITFATGRLVAWTLRSDVDLTDWKSAASSPAVKTIALAQPKTAPYGRAAEAALARLGGERRDQRRVTGENIAQTAQFVETGHADLGFVALSLVQRPGEAARGRWTEVPSEAYAPVSLDHAGILTGRGARNPAARRYLDFLRSEDARAILARFGYHVPAPASPSPAAPGAPASPAAAVRGTR